MVARLTPRGLMEILREVPLESDDDPAPREAAAPSAAKVRRRGRDAVLEADDCEIIVYELFQDRA